MDVADVKPGMKGYGLTVFSGTKPERFDVEIISTISNFRPGQPLILIRTPHPKLDVARTVAGMSGSPIYIGGKMIGAYAYGWLFNVEPVAGVTPIKNMLDDLRRPIPQELAPRRATGPLPVGRRTASNLIHSGLNRYLSEPLAYDLDKHAVQVAANSRPALAAPFGSGLESASTQVMVGGLSSGGMALASKLLEPAGLQLLQAGGGGGSKIPADAPTKYVDGGVVHVQLVRGDVSMAGLGTVTHVVGDKLIAFGHPMLNGGLESLPTAIGKVHWILSTQNRSFKLGEPVRPLGTLVNDRQASIVVDTTRVAPTFPITISIKGAAGAPKTEWAMECAHDQFLAPSFTAVSLGSALETTAAERSDMTWRATSKLVVAGHGVLEFEDFGAGNRTPVGPGHIMRTRLVRAVGAALNNPWEMGRIKSVSMKVKVSHKRDVRYLRGAEVLDSELEPGQPARVRLRLMPYQGTYEHRIIEIPLDPRLEGKTVSISIRPGHTTTRIVPPPENFAQLMRVLPKMSFPSESLVVSYKMPGETGAAHRGKLAHRLPPGAADTLASTTRSTGPAFFSSVVQHVIPTKGFISGQTSVRVKVRRVIH